MSDEKVILLDEAIDDLEVGSIFYDTQQLGIGDYFVNSLLSDISSIEFYSGIHPIRFGYYRMLAKRFPFAIYYDVSEEVSRVVVVLDMRRDPQSIRKILSHRKKSQSGSHGESNP
jgi:hypothetical protein